MNAVRPETKCLRCRGAYRNHGLLDEKCPDSSGRAFRRRVQSSASHSFARSEIQWLDEVLRMLQRGGDVRTLGRSPAAATVLRKVQVMRERVGKLEQHG